MLQQLCFLWIASPINELYSCPPLWWTINQLKKYKMNEIKRIWFSEVSFKWTRKSLSSKPNLSFFSNQFNSPTHPYPDPIMHYLFCKKIYLYKKESPSLHYFLRFLVWFSLIFSVASLISLMTDFIYQNLFYFILFYLSFYNTVFFCSISNIEFKHKYKAKVTGHISQSKDCTSFSLIFFNQKIKIY